MDIDVVLALELSRQILGLPEMEDKEKLRALVTERTAALNPIDRATFRMQLGRMYDEATTDVPLTPGFRVIGHIGILLSFATVTAVLLYFVSRHNISPVFKTVLALPAILAALMTLGSVLSAVRHVRSRLTGSTDFPTLQP
jgi:hypothetical protein